MFNRSRKHRGPESSTPPPGNAVATVTDADVESFTTAGYAVVDFFAPWCGPCRALAPIFDRAASQHAGGLRFGRCDVDESPRAAARLNILSVPTIVVFDPSGREVDRLVGAASPRQLDSFLSDAVAGAA